MGTVQYPLTVLYCGNCTLPIEYCEYHPEHDKCKQWLEKNLPDEFEKILNINDALDEEGGEEKKRQKRGGKGVVKSRKKEEGSDKIFLRRPRAVHSSCHHK
uniref:Density-regulated protein n=1 Tax=Lygus hesperus TaxID=30085 RepID=A0A146L9Y5_LYGHE